MEIPFGEQARPSRASLRGPAERPTKIYGQSIASHPWPGPKRPSISSEVDPSLLHHP